MLEFTLFKLNFVLSKKDMELAYDGLVPLSRQVSSFDVSVPNVECHNHVSCKKGRAL